MTASSSTFPGFRLTSASAAGCPPEQPVRSKFCSFVDGRDSRFFRQDAVDAPQRTSAAKFSGSARGGHDLVALNPHWVMDLDGLDRDVSCVASAHSGPVEAVLAVRGTAGAARKVIEHEGFALPLRARIDSRDDCEPGL